VFKIIKGIKTMATTTITQLFDNIHNLPQVPDVVRELISQINNPDIDMSAIAKNVEKEPTISLKILRLVNSAHYGLSRKVSSVNEALGFLGMDEIKTLVVSSGLVSSTPKIDSLVMEDFWTATFLKATYAKALATNVGIDGNIAFTAAIISNIGTLLIHLGDSSAGQEIEQHLKSGVTMRYEYEARRLGFTSADVSAELSRRWKFSDELTDAIAGSSDPIATETPSKISCTIYLSEYLSFNKERMTQDELLENIPFDVVEKMNLSKPVLTEKVAELLTLESKLASLAA
jgi:HD-like signal output (HDOD) protein